MHTQNLMFYNSMWGPSLAAGQEKIINPWAGVEGVAFQENRCYTFWHCLWLNSCEENNSFLFFGKKLLFHSAMLNQISSYHVSIVPSVTSSNYSLGSNLAVKRCSACLSRLTEISLYKNLSFAVNCNYRKQQNDVGGEDSVISYTVALSNEHVSVAFPDNQQGLWWDFWEDSTLISFPFFFFKFPSLISRILIGFWKCKWIADVFIHIL